MTMRSFCVGVLLFSSFRSPAQMNAGHLLPSASSVQFQFTSTSIAIHAEVVFSERVHEFIFDTGAPTFISEALQEKYRFPVIQQVNVSDASGLTDSTAIVNIDTMRCGDLVFVDIPALVLDLGPMGAACTGVEGNLGSNAARFLLVDFDLSHKSVTLSPAVADPVTRYDPVRINGQSDVFFPLLLNGQFVDSAHFDSGSGGTVELAPAVAKTFAASYPAEVVGHGQGITSFGTFGPGPAVDQWKLKPGSTTLLGATIRNAPASLATNEVSRVGRGILRYGRLLINYPAAQARFEAFDTPIGKSVHDFGFDPIVHAGQVTIGTVWEGGPAQRAGIKSGDRVLAVQHKLVAEMDECSMEQALREAMRARKLVLRIQDAGGTVREVKVKPARTNNR